MFQPAMLVYWSVVVLFPISSNYLYLLGSSFLAGIFSSFENKVTPSSFPIFQNLYSRPYEEISPFDPEKKCRKKWSLEDLGTKILWFHGTSALFSVIFKNVHRLGWFHIITSPVYHYAFRSHFGSRLEHFGRTFLLASYFPQDLQ